MLAKNVEIVYNIENSISKGYLYMYNISPLALNPNTYHVLQILFWVIVSAVVFGIFFWLLSSVVASVIIYDKTLRRRSKEKWSRTVSSTDESHLIMDDEGMEWHRKNIDFKKDVHIVNCGLNLYGEYYDFGSDKCVIILSGRTESLRYGYYFAQPYAAEGFNVLVIDPRAHGLSDGEFNTVGFEESKDALAWARFIHDNFNIETIIFHGICIGAAGGMYAITSDDCPYYIKAIVTDGMFPNFGESMKNHLRERRKPTFPVYKLINKRMIRFTGHSMDFGPINVIEKLDRPILMLYSKEDTYSTPEFAVKLFNLVKSEKEFVWFEHGAHSMLRYNDSKKYDDSIRAFLSKYITNIKSEVSHE